MELHLTTEAHAFGSLVFELFGIDRIRTDVRRLKVVQIIVHASPQAGDPKLSP